MALTQISTGGVKDDAVTAGKIPANAVGSSEIADDAVDQGAIADEAVDEARLQISNAGTNGQFLSKQSGDTGGLTWATVDTSIADDSITQAKLADGAVGTDQLATNAVTDAKIANDSVAENQLKTNNDGTHGQYLKKISGATGGMGWGDVVLSLIHI